MTNKYVKNTIQNLKEEMAENAISSGPPDLSDSTKEGKQDPIPSGLSVPPQVTGTQTPPGIESVLEAVRQTGEKHDYVIKAILAVFASTFLVRKDPIWLLIVGNPSSNKTTLVDLISGHVDVYRLDTLTANPFSSGQREKEKPKDLLPLLDGKCFVIKEYATIFGRSDEMVKQLISDLVAIYDGEYAKHSPTRGTIRYKSFFSHVGCVTPMALNSRQVYMSAVGARFLFLRIDSLSDEERDDSMNEIFSNSRKSNAEIVDVVSAYCRVIKDVIQQGNIPQIPSEVFSKLKVFARLMARARGIVITNPVSYEGNDGKKRIHYEVDDIQIEEPFRALKQLKKFAECLAIVNGSNVVGEEEISIVQRVVLSSMPVRRADILRVFEKGILFTVKEAAEKLDKNNKTVRRNLDELVSLGVLDTVKESDTQAKAYFMKEEYADVLGFSIQQTETVQANSPENSAETKEKLPF